MNKIDSRIKKLEGLLTERFLLVNGKCLPLFKDEIYLKLRKDLAVLYSKKKSLEKD